MAKKKSGGLGRGLDALLMSAANEAMQRPEAVDPVENTEQQNNQDSASSSSGNTNNNTNVTQEAKKPERILVYDEELEQLAAAERAAAKRAQEEKAEKESQEKENSAPEWTTQEPVVEISPEAVASAPIIERIPDKKPTKRTAASEAAKAAKKQASETNDTIETKPNTEGLNSDQMLAASNSKANSEKLSEPEKKNGKKVDEDSEIVPLASIRPNPNQPRMRFKPEEIEELASSIEKDGLLQPILVRPIAEGKYEIIAGERRWQACNKVGLKEVPVRIKQADDVLALELALIENIQRTDLNPIEEAYGYRRIMEHKKITQSQLAQMVSKGRSTIANSLRLLDLPEDAQQLLYEEKITSGHARAILSVPTEEGRQKLTEKLISEKLSVRETENLARLFSGREKKDSANPTRTPAPKEFKMVARQLRGKLETNVQVKTVQGKNKIVIEFKDNEDLERLYKIIAGEE